MHDQTPTHRYAVVQVNDGHISVTIHDTEEEAYNDIIDTCLEAPEWLGIYPDSHSYDCAVEHEIEQSRDTMSPKELYATYIKPRLDHRPAGFDMVVTALLESSRA